MGYLWYNPDEGVGIDGVLLKKAAPKSEDNNGERKRDEERTERFNSFLERIESLIDKMSDAIDNANNENNKQDK